MKKSLVLAIVILIISSVYAKSITGMVFNAEDAPGDDGTAIILKWNLPAPADTLSLQKADSLGIMVDIATFSGVTGKYKDSSLDLGKEYFYRLVPASQTHIANAGYFAKAVTRQNWFAWGKLSLLLMLLSICAAIIYYIIQGRRGKPLFIRRISGLDSMDEAIGRATEKGKPILFVAGSSDLNDIQTIAALNILNHLAFRSAEYGTELIVPCKYSMVMSAARETVREAYLKAGKPDAYRQENIFYVTDDQFGYVAGVDGIMLREQPAANFFMGAFWAESLILTETGFGTGAIQTAGTGQPHQLPFFIVSCDYTLIGEELYAASAYLSGDTQQLGSLKGHDFGKMLVILLILLGVVAEAAGWDWFKHFFEGWN